MIFHTNSGFRTCYGAPLYDFSYKNTCPPLMSIDFVRFFVYTPISAPPHEAHLYDFSYTLPFPPPHGARSIGEPQRIATSQQKYPPAKAKPRGRVFLLLLALQMPRLTGWPKRMRMALPVRQSQPKRSPTEMPTQTVRKPLRLPWSGSSYNQVPSSTSRSSRKLQY